MHILVIEDDKEAAGYMVKGLTESGHTTALVTDGKEGLGKALTGDFDIMIVDRMLPGLDGLSIVSAVRAAKVKTPILFLSALGEVNDRIEGLRVGGDDYLTKPYSFSELLARIEALHRRHQPIENAGHVAKLRFADLELDLETLRVTRGNKSIPLNPREFRMLEYFIRNKGRVITRTMLLEKVWDQNFDPKTNVVDVYINRLRNKIDKDFDKQLIHTIRGAGYTLRETN